MEAKKMKMLIFVFKEEKMLSFLLVLKQILPFLLPPLIICLVFLFKWLNYYQISQNLKKNLPPSPPKLPIIGNLHQIGSIPQRSLRSLSQKYGPVMLLHLGSKPVLVVSSADAAEQVLKTHDKIFATRAKTNFAARLLYNFKDVSFSPYSEYWRQMRSICVVHLLSNKRVQSFKRVREEEIDLMLEKIMESCLSNSVLCIGNIIATLANNIVSRVAMGKRYTDEGDGRSNFKDLFEEFSMLLGVFNVGDYIPWLAWINHFNGMEAEVKRVAKEFDVSLENIVEEGIQRLEKRESNNGGGGEEGKEAKNFVDILLQV